MKEATLSAMRRPHMLVLVLIGSSLLAPAASARPELSASQLGNPRTDARASQAPIRTVPVQMCTAAPDRSLAALRFGHDRGMIVRADCRRAGKGQEGFVTRPAQTGRRERVPNKALAFAMFEAPPGTTIRRVTWGGVADRDTCDWLAQIRVMGADARNANKLLFGTKRNSPCNQRARGARPDRLKTRNVADDGRYNVPGANRIVQRVLCTRKGGCPIGADAKAYVLTQYMEVELSDVEKPSELGVTGGSLFGRWVRDEGTVTFTASDRGSGIQTTRVLGEGDVQLARVERECRFSQRVACPNGAGDAKVSTRDVPRQGTQNIWLEAIDAAGNPARVGPTEIHIDSLAPGAAAVTVDQGQGWRNTPVTTLRWSNKDNVSGDRPEQQMAPITDIGYEVCSASPEPERRKCGSAKAYRIGDQPQQQGAEYVTLDAPAGETEFSMWRGDAAGNMSDANASVPVTLKYDPAPPKIAFKDRSPADPTRLSATVSDQYSGVNAASTSIEISGPGTAGAWKPLDTNLSGSELAGNVEDGALAPGVYSVRATVTDNAGNTTIAVPKDATGAEAKLTLPLRIESRLSAGVATQRSHRRVIRRHGKRRVVREKVTTYRAVARVGFGHRVTIGGALTSRDGNPIPNAPINVFAAFATEPQQSEQLVGATTTGSDGRYSYRTIATGNRTLRFAYGGTPQILPGQASTQLRVPAATTFAVDRRTVFNGRAPIVFSGRVKSQPLPAGIGSKNVDLQWKVSPKTPWKTFESTTTDAAGRWRLPYKFSNIRSTVTLRFRAALPSEGGYWFERGHSVPIRVVVCAYSPRKRQQLSRASAVVRSKPANGGRPQCASA